MITTTCKTLGRQGRRVAALNRSKNLSAEERLADSKAVIRRLLERAAGYAFLQPYLTLEEPLEPLADWEISNQLVIREFLQKTPSNICPLKMAERLQLPCFYCGKSSFISEGKPFQYYKRDICGDHGILIEFACCSCFADRIANF